MTRLAARTDHATESTPATPPPAANTENYDSGDQCAMVPVREPGGRTCGVPHSSLRRGKLMSMGTGSPVSPPVATVFLKSAAQPGDGKGARWSDGFALGFVCHDGRMWRCGWG